MHTATRLFSGLAVLAGALHAPVRRGQASNRRPMAVAAALAAGVLAHAPAGAQTVLTPFTGATFAGDTVENRSVHGAALGFGGGVGFDMDFAYAPSFAAAEDEVLDVDGTLRVTTLLFNVRVGGAPPGSGAAPFVSGGIGLLRIRQTGPRDLVDLLRNDVALNIGGGLTGYLNRRVGIRGDIRYFRSLDDSGEDGLLPDPRGLDIGKFNYWRATVGVSLRF